jgi:hypothetical protein
VQGVKELALSRVIEQFNRAEHSAFVNVGHRHAEIVGKLADRSAN